MGLTKVNHPDLLDLASDTGATVFPKGTTAERPVSPEAGYIRFNTTDNVIETYDGTEWLTLDSESWTPPATSVLLVGGGGGGNKAAGGGGAGGGGVLEGDISLSTGETYSFTIGNGGAAATVYSSTGQVGGNTTMISTTYSFTAYGGGTGGVNNAAGLDGGSGGGWGGAQSNNSYRAGGNAIQANSTPLTGYGFDGGYNGASSNNYSGAGGGGAGAIGTDAVTNTAGNGGNGHISTIITSAQATTNSVGEVSGSDVYFSGGGGGGVEAGTAGTGGLGGGGNGVNGNTGAGPGLANTGGGAGGDGINSSNIPIGGSGVAILKIPNSLYTGTTTGSPVEIIENIYTILIYKSSGTYTA